MKYKLLSIEDGNVVINIGDYVQALAAAQFLPSIDGFVNREELSQYDGEECVVIMNGWYMHNPNNWPPSKKIRPVFLSFHINKKAAGKMLTNHGVTYLKENEPIGCRDRYTLNLLRQRGIESWFTGCLTLTLGEKYTSVEKKENVYFVDPCIPTSQDRMARMARLVILLKHPILVHKISKKLSTLGNYSRFRHRLSLSSQFILLYSKIFTKECLGNAIFIEHESKQYNGSNEEKLYEAEKLIRLYSRAKFVVTSRLHCALPCLGLQTPVYFTQEVSCYEENSCRFEGLTELFNKMTVSSNNIICDFNYTGFLSESNIVENKRAWEPLAKAIAAKCKKMVKEKETMA